LLENVGAEIDPLRLIRRIKDGLQIPGLKPALIKILQEFNLQLSLLDDTAAILYHDGLTYSQELTRAQREGMQGQVTSICSKCEEPLLRSDTAFHASPSLDDTAADVYFLCRHVYHLSCLVPSERIPKRNRDALPSLEVSVTQAGPRGDGMYGPDRRSIIRKKAFDDKLRYEARLRSHLKKGCPACHKRRASRDI
jgi:vacuolar protein sorting-associated protein 41